MQKSEKDKRKLVQHIKKCATKIHFEAGKMTVIVNIRSAETDGC